MRNQQKILEVLESQVNKDEVDISTSGKVTLNEVVAAAVGTFNFEWDADQVQTSFDYVKKLTDGNEAVYGITTSFGGNIKNLVQHTDTNTLQHNLVTSHAANVGTYLPYEISRGASLLRMLTVSKGYSGMSLPTLELMRTMLQKGIVPAVQAHGSMGASGDLSPLSAGAHVLMGEGFAYLPDRKTIVPTKEAFDAHGLTPVKLTYREGLALINGTSLMTSVSSFYLSFLRRLLENSLAISSLTVQALQASTKPFDSRLHDLKPHRYQKNAAAVMHELLLDSKLALSHEELKKQIEDSLDDGDDHPKSQYDLQGGSYSLRAIPQVYQPILQLFAAFEETVNIEINALDDNPLMLPDEEAELHGANFHGHPISVVCDALNAAVISVANISHSRLDRMLKPHLSGLPSFLATGQEGLYLGLQGAQYTSAGICAELRGLAHPLATNQVVTNNDNQDIVSFGLQSSLKGIEITFLTAYALAVEYIGAVQGLWIRFRDQDLDVSSLSPQSRAVYEKLLPIYQPVQDKDQRFSEAIEAATTMLLTEDLLDADLRKALWS